MKRVTRKYMGTHGEYNTVRITKYLTKRQITKVLELAELRREANPELRYGQALFNALYELNPEVAQQIRGTDLDMFYNDRVALDALFYLKRDDLQIRLPNKETK